jgi:hypothetical protein
MACCLLECCIDRNLKSQYLGTRCSGGRTSTGPSSARWRPPPTLHNNGHVVIHDHGLGVLGASLHHQTPEFCLVTDRCFNRSFGYLLHVHDCGLNLCSNLTINTVYRHYELCYLGRSGQASKRAPNHRSFKFRCGAVS